MSNSLWTKKIPQIAALVNKIVPKGNESDADRESRFKMLDHQTFLLYLMRLLK